jgi:hypothetical protein
MAQMKPPSANPPLEITRAQGARIKFNAGPSAQPVAIVPRTT